MTRRRYLLVRLAALGDVVMMSALVQEIRRRDEDAHITWLCGSRVRSVVELLDVDDVIVADEISLLRGSPLRRARALLVVWWKLAGRSFDRTLFGHADSRYRLLTATARTGRLRALDHSLSKSTLPLPGRYLGDEFVRLLDDEPARGPIVGHYPLARVSGRLPAREQENRVGIVLGPGGARNVLRESALRRWPVERYRELAESLLQAGHCVTLVGDESDAWVRTHFAGLAVRDEIGRHDVPGTIALLQAADLVVVHDTGILHLARLARTPVIALFGPTIPSSFLVSAPDAVALWGGSDLACRPCYNGRDYAACTNNVCIQRIQVNDVLQAVSPLIAARRGDSKLADSSEKLTITH
jgi:heptosyltransferase-2